MAFSDPISTVQRKENHYSKREVDELDEQKVNFKSQPNKEKSYLCILPVALLLAISLQVLFPKKTGLLVSRTSTVAYKNW